MSEVPNSANASAHDAASDVHTVALDPVDSAWLARRSALAPLVLGVIAMATSPIILGLLFGPLGMRSGIDLWRRGARNASTAAAVATSFAGIVLSVMSALVWGALLASVLLGRDAIRAAESWRGEEIRSTELASIIGTKSEVFDPARPGGDAPRQVLLFVAVGFDPCADALRALSEAARMHPGLPIAIVDQEARAERVQEFVRGVIGAGAESFRCVGASASMPPPLDGLAAIPTLVVVARDGRIEKALVGAHPAADIERLLRGDAALPAPGAPNAREHR